METTKRTRRRPLHTCGASCLAVAHKACTKAQDLNSPLGSLAKWAIFFTHYLSPIIYALLYQWLAMLSLIDDQILTVQTITEKIIPSSTQVFDKMDGLVHSVEILPENLDRLFPLITHKFPFLDWIVVRLIACLNSILSILTHWGSSSSSSDQTREKEITIDVMNRNDIIIIDRRKPNDDKCLSIEPPMKRLQSLKDRIKGISDHHQHCASDSPMYSSYHSANSSPVSDLSADETYPVTMMSCSYKEMLERGTKEDDDAKDDNAIMLERGTKEDDDAKDDNAL